MYLIELKCVCGAFLAVPPQAVGRNMLCPECGGRASIPSKKAIWARRIVEDQMRQNRFFFAISQHSKSGRLAG